MDAFYCQASGGQSTVLFHGWSTLLPMLTLLNPKSHQGTDPGLGVGVGVGVGHKPPLVPWGRASEHLRSFICHPGMIMAVTVCSTDVSLSGTLAMLFDMEMKDAGLTQSCICCFLLL